jgi:hypothetical protein
MRVASGILACLAALGAGAFAAPSVAAQSTYHIHGYYKLYKSEGIWEHSSDSPWQVVKDEPWIDSELTHFGYVPMTHDSQRFYCLIEDHPSTGSNILEKTFICGDPDTVKMNYIENSKTHISLYGGGR